MNDNDDNIVEFPTKDRKKEVMKERSKKITDFSSSFSSPYTYTNVSFSTEGFERWIPPEIGQDTISFSNLQDINWVPSFGPNDTNLLTSIVDRCAAIQKQCISAGARQDAIALQHVLDKLEEALMLSKISSK